MGAACGTAMCRSKKHPGYQYPPNKNRPSRMELSFEEEVDGGSDKISIPPDHEEARIGVYF